MAQAYSLKNRLTLFTLAVFLLGLWLLVAYADWHVRREVRSQTLAQQASVTAFMARSLEQTLQERQAVLYRVSRHLGQVLEHDPRSLASPINLFQVLKQLPQEAITDATTATLGQSAPFSLLVLQQLFNGGAFIVNTEGLAVASFPPHAPRTGHSYAERDYIQQALAGQASISPPIQGRVVGKPSVMMAVPIWGESAQVIGAVVGVLDLTEPNFLEPFKTQAYGKTGHFFVIDRNARMILATSDPQRLLEQLPPPGADPVLDRFATGVHGQAEYTTRGTPLLLSVQQLIAPAWAVAVTEPLAEIDAPVASVRRSTIAAALVLSLLAAAGTRWLLRRELRPLERMAHTLAQPVQHGYALQRLHVPQQREVGQLATVFNHMLDELERRQQAMRDSEARYRSAFMTSPDALEITQASDGMILDVNAGFERLFGWRRDEVVGRTESALGLWSADSAPSDASSGCAAMAAQLLRDGQPRFNQPMQLPRRDGTTISALVSASLLQLQEQTCILWVTQDVSAFEQAHAQIAWLRSTDTLTGLPNRQQFLELLAQVQDSSQARGQSAALLHIDLDDFQMINDTLGHTLGDDFLLAIAERLRAVLAADIVLARPGGDEFLAVIPALPASAGDAAHQTLELAQRMLAAIEAPVPLQGQEQSCSACIGVTLLEREHQDPTELLRQADLTLNQAKNAGPGSILFYEPHMLDQVSSRARLQRSLREALHRQSFSLHYQPQINADNQVVGVEALVRWHLQGQGMVSPAEFIPLAEKTGLILPLGRWILHTACTQLAAWAQQPARAGLTIAVNVSAGQFQQDNFVEQVQEVLAETGAPAQQLKLELTESVMVHDIEEIIARMQALRGLGVRFSIDDFGTGFSSLTYLKRLPLDQLKIDQGFVRDCLEDHNDASIAQTVIALGQSLKLEVIAEGVETAAHQAALLGWGCRFFQGYGISKPVPIDALEAFLDAYAQDGSSQAAG